jgi:hypothetical protein
MICKEVRKHQKEKGGYIDLIWLKKHVATCKECQATLEVAEDMLEDSLTEDQS